MEEIEDHDTDKSLDDKLRRITQDFDITLFISIFS